MTRTTTPPEMPADTALEKALRLAGVRSIAAACGVTHQAVYKWRRTGIPVSRAHGIEMATRGQIRAEEICPGVIFTRDAGGHIVSYTLSVIAEAA